MDVLICLSAKDGRIVKKNIACIRRFLMDDGDRVFVISHGKNKLFFSDKWLKRNNCVFN